MQPFVSFFGKEYDISHIRQLALDAVPQSVVLVDALLPDHPIIYINSAFERLSGYTANEVLGINCRFMAGPDTSPETRAAMRDAIANNLPFNGLILNYRKDGSTFWNELTITPIEDGEARYFIGVQCDVSERLALEASLRESQKMEALGKLSGGIAHDFNNILALIMGNAEIVAAEGGNTPMVQSAIADIIDAADGGATLIKRMLQFARGEHSLAEPMSVNRAIGDAIALLSRTLGESVRLEHDFSAAVGDVRVDKTMFESAIINLVLNARDAMPRGGTVRIVTRRRLSAEPMSGAAAVVAISDSGTGMDEATRRRAFEPFLTTKAGGRGTGLGLSMIYRLVQQAGGDVTIDSTPGGGTTIEMVFPMIDTAEEIDADDAPKLRLLVVEDDPKVRKMLAIQLHRAGYAIEEAADGEEALGLLRGPTPPEMMVSDIRLGEGMSGIDLVAAARSVAAGLPVLLITGFSDELENPPDHIDGVPILRKPFRAEALLNAVRGIRPGLSIVR